MRKPKPTLTVGQLRESLSSFNPDLPVRIEFWMTEAGQARKYTRFPWGLRVSAEGTVDVLVQPIPR